MIDRLLRDGHEVTAVVRNPGRLGFTAGLETVAGDVVTGEGLDRAMPGCNAAIHLVGIIHETRQQTFEQVHHAGTRNVVEAAKRAGVERFIQMSALGARADGVSRYQTSKWRGEEEVRSSGIPYVILRPSIIFGPGDGFVSQMVQVMKTSPFVRPVPGKGTYKFRPIYIDDVMCCFAQSLSNERALGKTVELGGPQELSLSRMLEDISICVGVRKPAFHVPFPIVYANAAILGSVMRKPPVTTDQLRMLREGSTCDIRPMKEIFGLNPVGFREGLMRYLCRTRAS